MLAALGSLAAGAASLLARQAERLDGAGADSRPSPGSAADLRARALLRWAQRLDPGNPLYVQWHGRYLERLAARLPPDSAQMPRLLGQAERLYEQAARLRPTWPLSLTPILGVGLKLDVPGPKFDRLYRRTGALGRSEPAALRALLDLGLIAWPWLDPDGRIAVSDLLAHGLRQDPDLVLERAAALRRTAPLRPLVRADARLLGRYREILHRAADVP